MPELKPGKVSFMHTNMIPDTMLGFVASSQAVGVASKPQKEGTGSASAAISGTYTGTQNLDFYVEIETTGEIGATTFKWSSNGGQSFNAVGVGTSTSPVVLMHGLSIAWSSGAGDDVVSGDTWRFKAFLPYHRNKLLDRERDTEWRSADGVLTATLTATLTAAAAPRAIVLLDHNLTAGASIRLNGQAIPWQSERMLAFLSQTASASWALELSDPTNPDNYLRASEYFLGDYDRLSRSFELGDLRGKLRVGQRDRLLSGKYYGAVNTVVRAYDFSWVRLSQTDRDTLLGVFDALNDLSLRRVWPVLFAPTTEDLTQVFLCEWTDGQIVATSETDAPERFQVPVRLTEMPRTLEGAVDLLSTEILSTSL